MKAVILIEVIKMNKFMKNTNTLVHLLMSILLTITLFTSIKTGVAGSIYETIPVVSVTTVRMGNLVASTHVSGTLVAKEEILISPQISGYEIKQIKVDIGDKVAFGDILIQLESKTLQVLLEQADADKARARASIRQAQAQIDSAKANLHKAYTILKRNQRLSSSGAIPVALLEDSETAVGVKRAAYEFAKEGITVAKTQLTQLTAKHKIATLNLARTAIKAPVAGIVSHRTARLGEIAMSGGEPLLKMIGQGEIELKAEVIETALSGIQPGDQAKISVSGQAYRIGEVRLISPVIDPHTRLGAIRISFKKDPTIRVGGFAVGWVVTDERKAIMVPVSAVISNSSGDVITLVNNGTIEKRQVETGILFEGKREIINGLVEGEQVLLRAGSFFTAGDKVRIAL